MPAKAANTTPAMMTLWKWATRNRLLCSKKSAGGTARSTPVIPPIVNVTRNPQRPQHRGREADAAAVHREQPVVDLHPGADRDDAGGDAEEGVDVGARPHGEEMVHPDEVGDEADEQRRRDHGAIVEQGLT